MCVYVPCHTNIGWIVLFQKCKQLVHSASSVNDVLEKERERWGREGEKEVGEGEGGGIEEERGKEGGGGEEKMGERGPAIIKSLSCHRLDLSHLHYQHTLMGQFHGNREEEGEREREKGAG